MSFIKRIKHLIYHHVHIKWCIFQYINLKYGLRLDYSKNKNGVHILQEIFLKKVYILPELTKSGIVIVDVGAHYGFFSLFALDRYKEKCWVYAVEPSTTNNNILRRNIKESIYSNFISVQAVISKVSGERQLFLSTHQNNSLYQHYAPMHNGIETVKSYTLSDFMNLHHIAYIDILKMDCEGSEHEIIMSLSKSALSCINYICIEMHHLTDPQYSIENTLEYLTQNGFEMCYSNEQNSINTLTYFNHIVMLKNINYN